MSIQSPEVVATASFPTTELKITGAVEVCQRAERACSLGSAACGYAGTELSQVPTTDAIKVAVLCNSVNCPTDNVHLQLGLDRLAAQAKARQTTKSEPTSPTLWQPMRFDENGKPTYKKS